MTPEHALALAAADPDGQLTKRRSGWWIAPSQHPSATSRVDTATIQACIRAGWLRSTPSRDGTKIRYAVTITPAGAQEAAI